jgi:hypothetical protein
MASNKKLQATITIGGALSGTLAAAFGKVKGKIGELGKTISDAEKRQKLLGRSIQEFGRAGKNVDGMRERYAKLTADIDRARRAHERLVKAQAFKSKAGEIGGALRGASVRSAAGGAVIGGLLYTGIHSAITRENAVNIVKNTGETKENTDAMIKAAEGAKQFGVSTTEAVKIVGELRQALGTAHHAIEALPTALKAMSGLQLYNRSHPGSEVGDEAIRALAKIADERGATGAEAQKKQFDWAFRAITSSSNTVTADDLLVAQRGAKAAGLAMDDKAFFGDTFLMQALSAPSYGKSVSTLNNALIGGHQDAHKFTNMLRDGLLDPKKVQLKNGLVTNYQQDALIDHELLIKDQQAWVEKHLIPLAKRKGVNIDDPAAVQSLAARYFSNPSAANVMFLRMHNRVGIGRDRENAMNGHGVDESDAANRNSTAGKEANARARLDDAQTRVGNILLPAFATAMEKVADTLERVNKFADENPRLMKAMVMGLGGLAVGLTAAAPLLLTASGILNTIALIRLARATAEVNSLVSTLNGVEGAAAGAAGGIGKFVGLFSRIAGMASIFTTIPNLTTKQEDDELENGKAKWAALRAKYPQSVIDAARKKYQPWYQLGEGYASENEEWINRYLKENPSAAPKAPPMATARSAAPVVNTNDTYTFNLTQQPGQDPKEFADSVIRRMKQEQAKKSRSIMFDGANQ